MATVPLRDIQVLAGPRWIGMPRMSSPERPGKTATSHNVSAWLPVGRYQASQHYGAARVLEFAESRAGAVLPA